ncbi:MAG: sulfotransferase [Acidimicrobiia bacterium]|nr:sulfotransferase [Acidimicrobiia bacterium]
MQVDALLDAAERATGLSDHGDDTLGERVEIVLDAVRTSGLDDAGRAAAVETIHGLLTARLGFFHDRTRFPLADEQIVRPMFATGEPRSGTTLLHALMSVDPGARALRFWEVMYPTPPPGPAAADDPRRAAADDDWRDILERIPAWLVSHPYNDLLGDGLPECERTWAFDFRAMTPSAWWRVPMLMRPALPQDPVAQYRIHRMMLQHVQYGRPERRWVLKGFHGHRLAALFETYPDACVVWIHRDPVQVIASQITAFGQINECLAGSLDWPAYAAAQLASSKQSFLAHLDEPLVDDARIHHVRYPDFVRDPVGVIRDFYERFDVPFTAGADAAMRAYLEHNRSDRYGRFVYSTDVLAVDLEELHRELAPYRERFGLTIETRA